MAVFGVGAVGLAVIEGALQAGATKIFAVDTNPTKEAVARQFGATDFVNPKDHKGKIQVRVLCVHAQHHDVQVAHWWRG